MANTLYDQLRQPNYYYLHDRGFREFLEMNLPELRKHSQAKGAAFQVSEVDKARADRNFNLLCNIAKIPYPLHWVTMRVNNYLEYTEFRAKDASLYMVDMEYLALLKLRYDEAQSNN